MGLSKSLLYTLMIVFVFISCDDDDTDSTINPEVTVDLIMKSGSFTVNQGETIELASNEDLLISLFRLYLSNVVLETSSGEEVELSEVVLLDPSTSGENSFTAEIAAGTYSKLKFGLGVDADMNNMTPSSFEQSHPLSTYQNMYWSMLKYRFAKFEGKLDERGMLGGSDDVNISFHPGTDDIYKQVELAVNLSLSASEKGNITLEIDMDELFAGSNPFDFSTESQTHSTTSDIQIADKFMSNLKASLSANYSAQ